MNDKATTYRSNGKLLLTAEYAVLDGAKALAIPTKYGQSLVIKSNDFNVINWKSYNELNEVWFECTISYEDTSTALNETANPQKKIKGQDVKERLIQILNVAKNLNPEFLKSNQGFDITTHQDFNRLWGLGTSSTLINNIAEWAHVDAYQLLEKTFGGSGYDIACAKNNYAISFQLQKHQKNPNVKPVTFQPEFKHQLYFVYLNEKQNSRDGISAYKALGNINSNSIDDINSITEAMLVCKSLIEFQNLIEAHENIISNLIQQAPIQSRLFSDFNGAIKSLGAWGGDFILVASEENPSTYFNSKGFETVLPYEDMVLI
ncbi:GHMP kinase [Winogradskyella sp. F6397]|uniref:GHMP kinase n=1 Tax=Winogradskyella marina TaxID=2785530 RepID=A0ABS0EDP0_9FLAO|nr:GYDIA family GHMP kinase [Winogradskyella marina]MBF8148562.1 GHMP kinase [Winogradskyella marina]